MPGRPPPGEPAPLDGRLPPAASAEVGRAGFGVYLHVPFCLTRCGYCDFNTYTPGELAAAGGSTDWAERFVAAATAELRLARRVLGPVELPVQTVFFGGGTPTVLSPGALRLLLRVVAGEFGLAPAAEVTVEANPESVDPARLAELRAAGVNRLSVGMQSATPAVLRTLDRVHTPGRAVRCVRWARAAGFDRVSLDLIYGTPGESTTDWADTLAAALGSGVDHLSAYPLTVEPGTRLARRVRRGELPAPDEDQLADRYRAADGGCRAAGLRWYEISNWARSPAHRCRHNLGYWTGGDWWGIGPGAHSHLAGIRWWNLRHPARYAQRLAAGASPAAGRELLDPATRWRERVMLGLRLADGLPVGELGADGLAAARWAAADGLLAAGPLVAGRAVLTLTGRLLADTVVRSLWDRPPPPYTGTHQGRVPALAGR